jgi:hypothetical protein
MSFAHSKFVGVLGTTVNVRPPKQVQRHLHPEEITRLKQAYESGGTLRDLASEFQIHRTAASELLQRSGIARRRRGLSEPNAHTAVNFYRAGKSTATIGKLLGLSYDTVRQRLIRRA